MSDVEEGEIPDETALNHLPAKPRVALNPRQHGPRGSHARRAHIANPTRGPTAPRRLDARMNPINASNGHRHPPTRESFRPPVRWRMAPPLRNRTRSPPRRSRSHSPAAEPRNQRCSSPCDESEVLRRSLTALADKIHSATVAVGLPECIKLVL
jgi:hypothetical protein